MKNKLLVTVFLVTLAGPLQAFDLLGFKWFNKPGYSYKPDNGPKCCISPSVQEAQILQGRNQWGNLRNLDTSPKEEMLFVSWDKLGKIVNGIVRYDVTLGRADQINTEENSCQECAGKLFIKLSSVRVRFNNQFAWYDSQSACQAKSVGADLRGVAAHEFGHAIGLDHSNVADSTMTAKAEQCDFASFPIKNDDVSGHHAIYKGCAKKHVGKCVTITVKFKPSGLCGPSAGVVLSGGTYTGPDTLPKRPYDTYIFRRNSPATVWVDLKNPKVMLLSGTQKQYHDEKGRGCARGTGGYCKHKYCTGEERIDCLGEFTVEPGKTYCQYYSFSPACTGGIFHEPTNVTYGFGACE